MPPTFVPRPVCTRAVPQRSPVQTSREPRRAFPWLVIIGLLAPLSPIHAQTVEGGSLGPTAPASAPDPMVGPAASVGIGAGRVVVQHGTTNCTDLRTNADGSYENAYAWQYGGTVAPDFGAFADCFTVVGLLCGAAFDFTAIGYQAGQTMDVYAWESDGGQPGAVAAMSVGVDPGPVAFWPALSRHVVDLVASPTTAEVWVGSWGDWPGERSGWFIGADTNGFGGCPHTNIAPGVGYPTGWQNVSIVWGTTQALGIGALFGDDQLEGACCDPDGSCHVTTFASCSGTFLGAHSVCDPNPCPQVGACCFADGTCLAQLDSDCVGDWYEGACEPNPCPPPPRLGACCFPAGDCLTVFDDLCLAEGGSFLGEAVPCAPNPCPQPVVGACCLRTGGCTLLTATACALQGGDFLGGGVPCEPAPCPVPVAGACCLAVGECELSDDMVCSRDGGDFQGPGSTCSPNPCPPPCTPFALGGRSSATRPHPAQDPFAREANPGLPRSTEPLGPNRYGVLVLHSDPELVYTDTEAYCERTMVAGCADLVAHRNDPDPAVIHALALFPEEAPPRLRGVTFGLDFPDCVSLLAWESCGDFELAQEGWPAPGTGTAVTWGTTQTDPVVEVYWFAAYGIETEPGELALIPHPTQGADFADDSVPALLDPIAALGSFGFFRPGVVPCPPEPEPVGACCLPDGSCLVESVPGCAALGGVITEIGIGCDPDPCAHRPGACCLPADGACVEVPEEACLTVDGVFLGIDVPCTPDLCTPVILGACCFVTGDCLLVSAIRCSDDDGQFLGEGTICAPDPCPPSGACCLDSSGNCAVLFATVCASEGGTFLGDGTNCSDDPCPRAGACCFPLGECILDYADVCQAQGGSFLGEAVPCDPNPCPQPVRGACCREDGTCAYLTSEQCAAITDGVFIGPNVPCDPNPCPGAAVGACCLEEGICRAETAAACGASSGEFLGSHVPCSPNPCPQPPRGACCFPDGTCSFLTADACDDLDGAYAEGTPCQPQPCPQPPEGACCLLDDRCIVANAFTCEVGVFLGAGTTCQPDPCAAPELGACCYPDGGCLLRTAELCDGSFDGAGSVCIPDPCPPLGQGACCFPSGVCLEGTAFLCAYERGNYLGDGSACDPDPCPDPVPGACCFPDGSCTVLPVDACITEGGYFTEEDSDCAPNPCPTAVAGACCLPLGTCAVSSDLACAAADGVFQGEGATCTPNPCPQPCAPFFLAGREGATRPAPSVDIFSASLRRQPPSTRGNGPNRAGTLILHAAPGLVFTDDADFCGVAGDPDCGTVVNRADDGEPVVVHVLAAFPESATPRLLGLTFGITYPDCVQVLDWQSCGDFEIVTPEWPGPGAGTAVTWAGAQTTTVVEVYWFAAAGTAEEPGEIALQTHPTQEALFADDAIPANLDPIVELGSFGFFRDGSTPCPGPQTPIGACCFEDGACRVWTFPNCAEAGGNFLGVERPCDPDPCRDDLYGACCLPSDGSCTVANESGCALLGGTFLGADTSCDLDPCADLGLGACCRADGSCVLTLPDDCAAMDGRHQGGGVACAPTPCPASGACCFPAGLCLRLFADECTTAGGTFRGDGVACEEIYCPRPGACCSSDGTCRLVDSGNCTAPDEAYLGDGTSCAPNPCPAPLPGACCFQDGVCLSADRFVCEELDGDFLGESAVCTPNPCPQPTPGACCLREGPCLLVDHYVCLADGGTYLGAGSTCDPNPCPQPEIGACCLPDASCAVTFDFTCAEDGGVFFGDDTVCEAVHCGTVCDPPVVNYRAGDPVGGPNVGGVLLVHANLSVAYTQGSDYCGTLDIARCDQVVARFDPPFERVVLHVLAAFPEESMPRVAAVAFGVAYADCFVLESWGSCADLEIATPSWPTSGEGTAVAWASAQTDTFFETYWFGGYVDSFDPTIFALAPHPTEGAVFADDALPSHLDPIGALGTLGFRTDGFAPCPDADALGACCDWVGVCTVRARADCEARGDHFAGYRICDPNPCPQPAGACCVGGACVLTTDDFCNDRGGEYQGDGSDCTPHPCSGTVCCLDDQCYAVYVDCERQGGTLVPGESCEPSPCPLTGACCFEDESCQVLLEGECAAREGAFLGFGRDCTPNPCGTVPTLESSWGRIKDRFRGQ